MKLLIDYESPIDSILLLSVKYYKQIKFDRRLSFNDNPNNEPLADFDVLISRLIYNALIILTECGYDCRKQFDELKAGKLPSPII